MTGRKTTWMLVIFGCFALLFLAGLITADYVKAAQLAAAALREAEEKVIPTRLIIPKIRVDAAIEPVGLTGEGAMSAPATPSGVGWLATHPKPGENGNAVMDGHRGWKNQIPAVFDHLYELEAGDRIYVGDGADKLHVFVVRKKKAFLPGQDAAEVFADVAGAHLNLITCDGDWDTSKKSYARRLVVFADKE